MRRSHGTYTVNGALEPAAPLEDAGILVSQDQVFGDAKLTAKVSPQPQAMFVPLLLVEHMQTIQYLKPGGLNVLPHKFWVFQAFLCHVDQHVDVDVRYLRRRGVRPVP